MNESVRDGEGTELDARYTARLDSLADLPVVDHADVYQLIHADLQAALAEIDGR